MDSRIENVLLYITQNFRKELFLDGLAERAHLSKFHFQRLFTKELGVSPLQYINKIRLEHSAHILVVLHNCTPADAAFDSGFSSPAVFSRSFKKYYNLSPSQYQKEKKHKSGKKKSDRKIAIPITYQKKQTIQVLRSNLIKDNLDSLFSNLQKNITSQEIVYGFFVDTPMHVNHDKCRYYAGFRTDDKIYGTVNSLEIEEGYYTFLEVNGDMTTFEKQIVEFKEKYIDASPYTIASPIAFEKFKLQSGGNSFDYFKAQRTVYIKIKR